MPDTKLPATDAEWNGLVNQANEIATAPVTAGVKVGPAMRLTSRTDQPWWSDPGCDESGRDLRTPPVDEDADYERHMEMLREAEAEDEAAGRMNAAA